jgi:hypothetical protein
MQRSNAANIPHIASMVSPAGVDLPPLLVKVRADAQLSELRDEVHNVKQASASRSMLQAMMRSSLPRAASLWS